MFSNEEEDMIKLFPGRLKPIHGGLAAAIRAAEHPGKSFIISSFDHR
jgi:hypothetical protein